MAVAFIWIFNSLKCIMFGINISWIKDKDLCTLIQAWFENLMRPADLTQPDGRKHRKERKAEVVVIEWWFILFFVFVQLPVIIKKKAGLKKSVVFHKHFKHHFLTKMTPATWWFWKLIWVLVICLDAGCNTYHQNITFWGSMKSCYSQS